MSECVVRMEMPKHCGECELKTWDIWPGSFKCVKTMHDIMIHIQNRTKPKDCPIICQLPEGHGRLVDEQELFERCRPVKNFDNPDTLVIVKGAVIQSQTIVPADTAERSET